MTAQPFSVNADGVRLAVRLTPRASRNAIDGVVIGADGRPALHVRLNARPVDGAANTALIAFLAGALKLRKAEVVIVSGETARLKIVQLHGDGTEIAARIAALIGDARVA